MTALADATLEQVGALGALTEMLVGVERSISSLQAARDGILAVGSRLALEVAAQAEHPDRGEMSARTVAAEFAAALRVSDRTVQRRMADAAWVVERFPLVWEAQGAGRISAAHARVVCEEGERLEDAASRDSYATQMIALAETESPARVGRMARRVVERFQARSIHERHLDAREKRSVWVKEVGDGMTQLGLLGPSALVHGAFERLTQMAKAVQGPEFLPVENPCRSSRMPTRSPMRPRPPTPMSVPPISARSHSGAPTSLSICFSPVLRLDTTRQRGSSQRSADRCRSLFR